MKSTWARSRWLVVPVLLLVIGGCAAWRKAPGVRAETTATPASALPAPSRAELSGLESNLTGIYAAVNPSVVNVQVTKKETVQAGMMPGLPDMFGFFGGPDGRDPRNPHRRTPQGDEPQERYEHAGGSGFVWDNRGHVVTNFHVVKGADKITVTLNDGTVAGAKLVGADRDSDLAVLEVKLPADRLKPVQVADSTTVKVGQLAVAIGNPFGLEGTMTVGFVSALGRLLPVDASGPGESYTIPDIIQTDAPINPGNSGGVLCNSGGEVIGVTTAIISPAGASAGIGFAIPSAIVNKVVSALLKDGKVEHPWLGFSGTTLSPDVAKAMGLPESQRGALVGEVMSGSPAEKAGVKGGNRQAKIEDMDIKVGGDVVVKMDDQDVRRFDDIVTFLARRTVVGQEITLDVLRDGKPVTLKVKLAARPAEGKGGLKAAKGEGAWLGIAGADLSAEVARAMKLKPDQAGVLVKEVQPGSPAAKAGLRGSTGEANVEGEQTAVGGDVITAIDGQQVTSMDDLQEALTQAAPGAKVKLSILRGSKPMDVEVTLGTLVR
ncbi:MAG: trypsin-like peptidase domain-containing protein [Armatimonadetes bacterium]|nr:trypsin-like peptidase domain-containing protein [Armatimonadota bacterium]